MTGEGVDLYYKYQNRKTIQRAKSTHENQKLLTHLSLIFLSLTLFLILPRRYHKRKRKAEIKRK